jgi:hypothetical protein
MNPLRKNYINSKSPLKLIKTLKKTKICFYKLLDEFIQVTSKKARYL